MKTKTNNTTTARLFRYDGRLSRGEILMGNDAWVAAKNNGATDEQAQRAALDALNDEDSLLETEERWA